MIGKQDRYIKKKLDDIFLHNSHLMQTEMDAMFGYFMELSDEADSGKGNEWQIKVSGVIQFLVWASRITSEQDEKLCMLMNEITDEKDHQQERVVVKTEESKYPLFKREGN